MTYIIAAVAALLIASGFGITIGMVGAGTPSGNVLTVIMLITVVMVCRRILSKRN